MLEIRRALGRGLSPDRSSGRPGDAESLVELLRCWDIPEGREDAVHDMALASLEQVKGSTEYEDARALLMIVAFLTALAGAVFNRFSLSYELPRWHEITSNWGFIWPALTYAMFGCYAVIVSGSAFVIFGAMKPTFHMSDPGRSRRGLSPVGLHARLLDLHPRIWGQSFIDLTRPSAPGRDDLKAAYAKHYIVESYVVAQRVAMKLKKAAPAVRWLQFSMLFLAAFIICYGASLIMISPGR